MVVKAQVDEENLFEVRQCFDQFKSNSFSYVSLLQYIIDESIAFTHTDTDFKPASEARSRFTLQIRIPNPAAKRLSDPQTIIKPIGSPI